MRVGDVIAATSTDEQIVAEAIRDRRIIVTQDLDFSALIALSGGRAPSVISLRLTSSRVENVNQHLERLLPLLESDLLEGALATIEDARVRTRMLPIA